MKQVTLTRWGRSANATFGRVAVDNRSWLTVERSLVDAEHPCIPSGTYALRLDTHHAGQPDAYPCYWVENVPNRTAIEIHVANWARELQGCIAPGKQLAASLQTGEVGVAFSKAAFAEFMAAMEGEPGTLTVADACK